MDVMTIKILVLVVIGMLVLGFLSAELRRPRRREQDAPWSRP